MIFKKWWSTPLLFLTVLLLYFHFNYLSDFILHPVPQAELARWSGKQMVQNSSIVSSTNGCWYISGADTYKIVTKQEMSLAILNKNQQQPLFLLDSKDISSKDQAVALEWHINKKLKLSGFFYSSDNIENPYIIYSDSLSFNKGYSYFGNRQLWSYTLSNSDSDSLYLTLILGPVNSQGISTNLQAPCFYNIFSYSMKDISGNELYKGDLRGKQLVWGIFPLNEIDNIKRNRSYKVIDLIKVSAKNQEIPQGISELIWQKPTINISAYFGTKY